MEVTVPTHAMGEVVIEQAVKVHERSVHAVSRNREMPPSPGRRNGIERAGAPTFPSGPIGSAVQFTTGTSYLQAAANFPEHNFGTQPEAIQSRVRRRVVVQVRLTSYWSKWIPAHHARRRRDAAQVVAVTLTQRKRAIDQVDAGLRQGGVKDLELVDQSARVGIGEVEPAHIERRTAGDTHGAQRAGGDTDRLDLSVHVENRRIGGAIHHDGDMEPLVRIQFRGGTAPNCGIGAEGTRRHDGEGEIAIVQKQRVPTADRIAAELVNEGAVAGGVGLVLDPGISRPSKYRRLAPMALSDPSAVSKSYYSSYK